MHRRIASALLLESLQEPSKPAVAKEELTLAVLRPIEVGCEPSEAMDRLMERCWHTYSDSDGERFHFGSYPNNVKRIEERMAAPKMEKNADQHMRTLAQQYFSDNVFKLQAFPRGPSAERDDPLLKLVLTDSEKIAPSLCDNSTARTLRRRSRALSAMPSSAPISAVTASREASTRQASWSR